MVGYIITHSGLFAVSTGENYYGRSFGAERLTKKEKPESKKQRRDRISKEKMYASWSAYNLRTFSIKELKQICKPRHILNYFGKRC